MSPYVTIEMPLPEVVYYGYIVTMHVDDWKASCVWNESYITENLDLADDDGFLSLHCDASEVAALFEELSKIDPMTKGE